MFGGACVFLWEKLIWWHFNYWFKFPLKKTSLGRCERYLCWSPNSFSFILQQLTQLFDTLIQQCCFNGDLFAGSQSSERPGRLFLLCQTLQAGGWSTVSGIFWLVKTTCTVNPLKSPVRIIYWYESIAERCLYIYKISITPVREKCAVCANRLLPGAPLSTEFKTPNDKRLKNWKWKDRRDTSTS